MEVVIEKRRYAMSCPVWNKKLITINSFREPITVILNENNKGKIDSEIRCPRCKTFVGINK